MAENRFWNCHHSWLVRLKVYSFRYKHTTLYYYQSFWLKFLNFDIEFVDPNPVFCFNIFVLSKNWNYLLAILSEIKWIITSYYFCCQSVEKLSKSFEEFNEFALIIIAFICFGICFGFVISCVLQHTWQVLLRKNFFFKFYILLNHRE